MKIQMWKIYVSEGIMGAIHGCFFPMLEMYVPELKLAINEHAEFLVDEDRYAPKNKIILNEEDLDLSKDLPDPELLAEKELPEQLKVVMGVIADYLNSREEIVGTCVGLFEDTLKEQGINVTEEDEQSEQDIKILENF